jgi:RNA polymerase sigma factor (sigma-70 family)
LPALAGDSAAYHRFLQLLTGHLRAFVRWRLTRWPDDVEDVVQDILLAVHNQRHTYQPEQPLTAWVHAIAKYKLIDLMRARSVREALHDPIDDDTPLFAVDDHAAGDARRDVATLLHTLPDRHRLPIECVKLRGLSVAEAALETGMTESAIKVGVHRGLKALAARLGMARTATD